MNLSIFVPTKNRFYYLSKLIKYYSSINFNGELIILDSSDDEIIENINKLIQSFKNLNIKLFHSFGLPCAMMKKYIDEASNDYVVFSGDDDYFVKKGMMDCIKFLEINSNFSGCNGEGICVHSSSKKNKIDYIDDYEQANINGINSMERINQQFNKYKVPIFSIFRKNYFKKFLEPVPTKEVFESSCPDKAIADEYIIEGAMVAYGNIHKLNSPYLVRHIHKERNIDNLVPDFKKDWINTPNFEKSKNYFFIKMSEIISKNDKIDIDQALKFFNEKFNIHLNYELKKEKKYILKIFLSKTLLKIRPIKNLRYFLKRNIFTDKKYSKIKTNKDYSLIINSIEGKI